MKNMETWKHLQIKLDIAKKPWRNVLQMNALLWRQLLKYICPLLLHITLTNLANYKLSIYHQIVKLNFSVIGHTNYYQVVFDDHNKPSPKGTVRLSWPKVTLRHFAMQWQNYPLLNIILTTTQSRNTLHQV